MLHGCRARPAAIAGVMRMLLCIRGALAEEHQDQLGLLRRDANGGRRGAGAALAEECGGR